MYIYAEGGCIIIKLLIKLEAIILLGGFEYSLSIGVSFVVLHISNVVYRKENRH